MPEPSDEWSGSVTIGGDVTGDAQLVGDGVYEVTGSGADVWGTSDQFHYLYKELTGDGSITCRVTDFGTGSNTWAKGGVMIRETLDPDSKHTIMAMTGGSGEGISFQGRITGVGASSTGMHSDITAAPPQWVRLTREGNTFTAYYSADGVAWELFTDTTPDAGHSNPIDVEMAATVKIGLFVTSHAAGELRTYTIDNVSMEGDIVGENTYVPTATNPVPADGATALAAPITLQWDLALGATAYDVYVSVDADIDAADLVGTTMETAYAIETVPGVTYYWRVDTADADLNTYEGAVWQFSMLSDQAHDPSPADGGLWRIGVDTELSWTSGLGALAHNVYFSADQSLVDARDPNVASTFWLMNTFVPVDLMAGTTYYWAVDEFTPPLTIAGPTWSFKAFAFDPITITDPALQIHYGFETGEGEMVNDLSGHENYGFLKGAPQWTTGVYGGGLSIDIATLDYVETGKPLGITSNTVTVTGWVIHDTPPAAWSGILTTRGSGNLGLQQDGTELRYMWGADQYWDFSSGLAIPNGEWYFAALAIAPDQATLYLNGVDANSTATNVAEHVLVDFDSLIRVGRDHVDGRIMTSTIDDVRFYNRTLTDQEIVWAMNSLADVTGADDMVQGVPNDGDWPGGEYPGLAVDDNSGTKFLHFKGETEPSGIQIAPAAGISIVKGLTLTTANDSPNRDPISYEVYGSNESIDGPYELIAAGDVNDFAQAAEYPRFTKNATTIAFDNTMAYAFYQVLFPTVRDASTANSMQIAEVELIGEVLRKPLIAFVSFHGADDAPSSGAAGDGYTEAPDKAYTDLLKANGYDVVRVITSSSPDVETLNAADLVITSRSVNSGDYSNDGATLWNGITSPMIILGGYPLRNSRMGYTLGGTMVDTAGDIALTVNDPNHPIFAGIELVDGVMANAFAGIVSYDDGTLCRGVSVNTDEVNAEGTVLATVATADDPTVGGMVIGEWQAGATLTHAGGAGTDILADHRLVFLTGSRENGKSSQTAGLYDLTEDGAAMFLNAVGYMLQ